MVSIVLPVYNGGDMLAESIESILGQSYRNFELIIVNDCSIDNTADIIKKYIDLDERVRCINNPINFKLPRALNAGFETAKGVYYTWTSADNIFKQNAIEKMVQCLEKNKTTSMVYANYTTIDEHGKELQSISMPEPDMLFYCNVVGACFLYTSTVAKKVGIYDANLFLAEDYDYWIRIFCAGKIVHLDEDLYYYRQHAGSLTSTRKEKIGIQTYRAIEKNFFPLYSMIKTNKQRNLFLDNLRTLIQAVDEKTKNEVMQRLLLFKRDYKWHLKIATIKSYIYNFLKK